MRFFSDGPSLPDELLAARDAGRVLFFCGAGVSRARAGLPGFFGLTRAVIDELRALEDSPARKLLKLAEEQEPIAGVGGTLAADRVFGLLEREFATEDIEAAVGKILARSNTGDVAAHRILLDLSRDPGGKVRIVTTNFDRLFETAARNVRSFGPDQLPDLRKTNEFEGVVHLHGIFDPTYGHSIGGSLVLSSAEFGRAYLAEGWATDFIRTLIRSYLIVIVGYAADDPPVQYLLEALSSRTNLSTGLYAFQSGHDDDVQAQWKQKGVRAIAYQASDDHTKLWRTLEAWAARARNPKRWTEKVLRMGHAGPNVLLPHERGQIVHLAAIDEGAQAIAQAKKPIPATWMCVFDPKMRYAQPGKKNPFKSDEPDVDPFGCFGIDSDPVPPPRNERQAARQREIPEQVVNVLQSTRADQGPGACNFQGQGSSDLAPRLSSLAAWFSRVCFEPAAVWWASGQSGLHSSVMQQVYFALEYRSDSAPPQARNAWRYVIDGWGRSPEPAYTNEFQLERAIKADGWIASLLRRYTRVTRCAITVGRRYWGGVLPPEGTKWKEVRDVIELEIKYPDRHVHFAIPEEQLETVIRILRQNIEYAVDLENEISPTARLRIVPIEPDPNLVGESAERDFGINPSVLEFTQLFRRLLQKNPAAALSEFRAWRTKGDPVFGRLRVWASRLSNFLDDATAAEVLIECDDAPFWDSRDQRDLLLTIGNRWKGLPPDKRIAIEDRLLRGPPRYPWATPAQYRLWRAQAVLERVTYLRANGCQFGDTADRVLARLRKDAPNWTPEQARHAADSREARGGGIRVVPSIDGLAGVPISELIPRAFEGQRRDWGSLDTYDPFAGLAEKRPIRLLAALRAERAKGADVTRPWTLFLHSSSRRTDTAKIAALIGHRIAALPDPILGLMAAPVAYWLDAARSQLYQAGAVLVNHIVDRLCSALMTVPESATPRPLQPGARRDWDNVAPSTIAWNLAEVLFSNPEFENGSRASALPADWLSRAERVLSLPGEQSRFALVRFGSSLGWLYGRARDWTEQTILPAFFRADDSRDAALAGFYINPRVFDESLYARLKPVLIKIATDTRQELRHNSNGLAYVFVTGWLSSKSTGGRWLSNDEFRRVLVHSDDNVRTQVLWQVERLQNVAEKLDFLRNVWPIQLAVRTAVVVGKLCTLAFDDEANFPELADAVLPLVRNADGSQLHLPVHRPNETITRDHPEKVLALLSTVLPASVARWPHGVSQILDKLVAARPSLAADPRLIRLKRLWDGR